MSQIELGQSQGSSFRNVCDALDDNDETVLSIGDEGLSAPSIQDWESIESKVKNTLELLTKFVN